MRNIKGIVIHCSATPPEMDIGVAEMRQWHKAKGWNDIGYHGVIRRRGRLEPGRPYAITGAHVRGHNTGTVGLCLVGGVSRMGRRAAGGKWISGAAEANYTPTQWWTLREVVVALRHVHPGAWIKGHNDFASKACPCFSVAEWLERGMEPAPEWIHNEEGLAA